MILKKAGKGSVEDEQSRHWRQSTLDSKFSGCYEGFDLL